MADRKTFYIGGYPIWGWAVVVLLFVGGFLAMKTWSPGVNRYSYSRLKVGMTYEDVANILGGIPENVAYGSSPSRDVPAIWVSKDRAKRISVTFRPCLAPDFAEKDPEMCVVALEQKGLK